VHCMSNVSNALKFLEIRKVFSWRLWICWFYFIKDQTCQYSTTWYCRRKSNDYFRIDLDVDFILSGKKRIRNLNNEKKYSIIYIYFLSESIGNVSEENCSQTVLGLLILTCSSHVSSKILDDKDVLESSEYVNHVDSNELWILCKRFGQFAYY